MTFTFAPHRILIAAWNKPLVEGDGLPDAEITAAEKRLGIALPAALREWYRIAGNRADVTHTQTTLRSPEELEWTDAGLIFYAEHQDTCHWRIRWDEAGQADPPVFRDDVNAEQPESRSVTEFLWQMLAQEQILSAAWNGFGSFWEPAESVLNELSLTRIGTEDWHWPQYPTRFYEADNLLVMTNGDEWFWFAAADREAHLVLLNRLDGKILWENVNRGES
jgi:hypothetical protein